MKHFILLFSSFIFTSHFIGCSKSEQATKFEIGKYVSQKDPTDVVEYKSDGTFFFISPNSHDGSEKGINGTYSVEGNVVTIKLADGSHNTLTVDGNKLTDEKGRVWLKQ